jgi:hypothetical protein
MFRGGHIHNRKKPCMNYELTLGTRPRYEFRKSQFGIRTRHKTHIVDLNARPFTPRGWIIKHHQQGGYFRWNPNAVKLHLPAIQSCSDAITGELLFYELSKETLLFNANLLDFLLRHTYLIPEEWKVDEYGYTRYIFFWGTIYGDKDKFSKIRYLYWDGYDWKSGLYWIGFDWNVSDPAICLQNDFVFSGF